MWSHGWGMGGMILWWIIGIVFVALIAWTVVRLSGGSANPPRTESPDEILKSRFARGEIDEEQYRRMLRELRE